MRLKYERLQCRSTPENYMRYRVSSLMVNLFMLPVSDVLFKFVMWILSFHLLIWWLFFWNKSFLIEYCYKRLDFSLFLYLNLFSLKSLHVCKFWALKFFFGITITIIINICLLFFYIIDLLCKRLKKGKVNQFLSMLIKQAFACDPVRAKWKNT